MNNLTITEGWHYKTQGWMYTHDLYVIKKVKIKHWFREVDWIVYSIFEWWSHEQYMTEKEFHRIALYQVN